MLEPPPELVATLKRLRDQYGEEAYRAATKTLAKAQRGRKSLPDDPYLLAMAQIIIDDRATVHAAATRVAFETAIPGHSRAAKVKRLRRKYQLNPACYESGS
jgi:hypothetical protein